jgi:hypothetical protein
VRWRVPPSPVPDTGSGETVQAGTDTLDGDDVQVASTGVVAAVHPAKHTPCNRNEKIGGKKGNENGSPLSAFETRRLVSDTGSGETVQAGTDTLDGDDVQVASTGVVAAVQNLPSKTYAMQQKRKDRREERKRKWISAFSIRNTEVWSIGK